MYILHCITKIQKVVDFYSFQSAVKVFQVFLTKEELHKHDLVLFYILKQSVRALENQLSK